MLKRPFYTGPIARPEAFLPTPHRPLNRSRPFQIWPHFEPGRWIDFNPSLVRLPSGQRYAVIRRDRVPPVPGKGTVWAVAVDDALAPAGQPFLLMADGEDPRAVFVAGRVLVFYVLFERDAQGRITGTSMVLAEFDPQATPWRPLAHFKLPKYPLGGAPAGSNPGWEKNWVPFVLSNTQVGLIYSHDPWQVIVLNIDGTTNATPEQRRFEQAWRADGLHWAFGGVRGGTPPLPYAENELITFFHSSEVVGSRKSYMAGACVFQATAPFKPLRLTREPLLVAPYHGGMHRHGWPVAASVIFPLGSDEDASGFRLLCGIDDGQIGHFSITRDELESRLQPLPEAAAPTLRHAEAELALQQPVLAQAAGATPPDWPLLRFLAQAQPTGRALLDVGGDAGLFAAGLAGGYRRVDAVATGADAAHWRWRTVALNGRVNVEVHLPQTVAAASPLPVARPPWGLASLDEAGFVDLDLVITDCENTQTVLTGLRHTLARDRPLLMLKLRPDGSEHAAITAWLADQGYSQAATFPRSPGVMLAAHASRRDEIAWFV